MCTHLFISIRVTKTRWDMDSFDMLQIPSLEEEEEAENGLIDAIKSLLLFGVLCVLINNRVIINHKSDIVSFTQLAHTLRKYI